MPRPHPKCFCAITHAWNLLRLKHIPCPIQGSLFGNCEELPENPVGQLSADRLPTGYRQVTNRLPTANQQLPKCRNKSDLRKTWPIVGVPLTTINKRLQERRKVELLCGSNRTSRDKNVLTLNVTALQYGSSTLPITSLAWPASYTIQCKWLALIHS